MSMSLDEIRAYWSALPGASYFGNAFPNGIGDVEVAEVDMRTADAAALQARARHRAALAALREQVEAEAAADWTATEVEAARAAAGWSAL